MKRSLQVALINRYTRAEGPGARFAVWVQGCPIRCRGCFNPHMFNSEGGLSLDVDEVIEIFDASLEVHPEIQGITFLGGEPFAQAEPLALLAQSVQSRGKSVITFSGYSRRHIERGIIKGSTDLMNRTDVLVAGPFIQSRIDNARPWLGSTNQEFVYLTSRYGESDFQSSDTVEITVDASGKIMLNGWSTKDNLRNLFRTTQLGEPQM